jgi:hypothetical protein
MGRTSAGLLLPLAPARLSASDEVQDYDDGEPSGERAERVREVRGRFLGGLG